MTTTPDVSPAAVAKAHQITTMFHGFIYFAPEAAASYTEAGVTGRSQYFGSRAAAMGAITPEVTLATFYNFSPELVLPAMTGLWDTITPAAMQRARWEGVRQVFENARVREAMTADAISEASDLAGQMVEAVSYAGRPLAAGNQSVLADLAASDIGDDALLRLWQQVAVVREWRGDAHIALLITEPLDGAECTVVSETVAGMRPGAIRTSRAWSDDDWAAATDRLIARGWMTDDGEITPKGADARTTIEDRTNELSIPMWNVIGESGMDRLGELLAPANKALLEGNYFAAIGRPAHKG